ncbi:gamma-glutamyltransferase [Pantanalinema sp. GBBB05]|uniref:gamma-glutamyltransferase n=1 Tax=Pantanalinema sp. GBBB05 TaxID=2604139 RepID=UPI001DD0FADB|nr:gamma-glutamyltransferase [Pantanalinema sp. GBBB05]
MRRSIHCVIAIVAVSWSIGWIGSQLGLTAPVRGKQGMVVSAHPLASQVGLKMLQQGGNAIDAAVATTLAISVVEPFSAGIGGGGFLLLRSGQTGEIKALDFRERAPLTATPTMYLDQAGKVQADRSKKGHLAVATPGTIAGLVAVHQQYGRLPWKTVVAPAIQLAENGFPVSPRLLAAINRSTLLADPTARQIFTRNGTTPLRLGDVLVQRDLAKTLRAIAIDPQAFYTGNIAKAIAQDMRAKGGLITLADLQRYRPIWREAMCGNFRSARICSMPPPSSGGVLLLEMLNLIGSTDLKAMGWQSPQVLHLLVEVMKIAYADRAEYLGDPDFVQVPAAALTSPHYAQIRRQEIDAQRARSSATVKPADRQLLQRLSNQSLTPKPAGQSQTKESADTTHLSVVDRDGNAISLTFTVNLGFGAEVIVPGTGIILNNEMDDFAVAPNVPNAFGLVGGAANAIAPSKTPLSSMTPTIVTENGKLRLVTGSPGGSTIITTVFQIVLNVLVYNLDVKDAVASPRIHHQWLPDQVGMEPGFDAATLANLRQRGHNVVEGRSWGNANAIVRTPEGWLEGAADPRGEGTAAGY